MKLLKKNYRIESEDTLVFNAFLEDYSFVCVKHQHLDVTLLFLSYNEGPLGLERFPGEPYSVTGVGKHWVPPSSYSGEQTVEVFRVRGTYTSADVLDNWNLFLEFEHGCWCDEGITGALYTVDEDGEDLSQRMAEQAFPWIGKGTEFRCPAFSKKDDTQRCNCSYPLWQTVMHLNDGHKWDREKIADYLETLDVDLSFPTPEDIPKEPGEA